MLNIELVTDSSSYSMIHELNDNLREEEVLEVSRSHNKEQLEVIRDSVERSIGDCWAFKDNKGLLAINGMHPLSPLSDRAIVWLLTTERAKQYPKQLVKQTRKFLRNWSKEYPVLFNFVDAEYEASIRWCKVVGFEVHPAEPFGHDGSMFHKVEYRR